MILDTTSKTLEVILAAVKTANDCEIFADWVDTQSGATFVPGSTLSLSNGTTAVTAVAAPAASTQRQIKSFSFYNADTANVALTVRIFDGAARKRIYVLTIAPGAALFYSQERGWQPPSVGLAPTMTKLFTVGSGNYTPPSGCTRIEVEFKGGGGGGTGTGTAGTIVGGLGGDAIFASYHATGGNGSASNFPAMGGSGGADGTAAAWARTFPGAPGNPVSLVPWSATTYAMNGGNGGGSGAGRTSINANDGIAALANTGAGGGAAGFGPDTLGNVAAVTGFGGGGSEAERRIIAINNPVGPYAYTVPDGGTAGPAGTSGHAGGKGGSGYIIIREFYD